VQGFPTPTTVTGVRSFVGIANFYRRFIKNFSTIAKPLFDLTKKHVEFGWNDAAEGAFNELKEKLTTAPVLVYPDFEVPFELHVDACDVGA
jgi:hypothetical protein